MEHYQSFKYDPANSLMDKAEYKTLMQLGRDRTVLEIGAFKGVSTQALYTYCKSITSIDVQGPYIFQGTEEVMPHSLFTQNRENVKCNLLYEADENSSSILEAIDEKFDAIMIDVPKKILAKTIRIAASKAHEKTVFFIHDFKQYNIDVGLLEELGLTYQFPLDNAILCSGKQGIAFIAELTHTPIGYTVPNYKTSLSKRILFISLTNKCTRSCPYCPMAQWRNQVLDMDSFIEKIDFGNNLPFQDLCDFIIKAKPDYVELTGGEPTMYENYNELCDILERNNIEFLTKSNGDFKGRNQVSAWHDTHFPKFYDKILIIKDTDGWEAKQKHCEEFNIPYNIIGKDNDLIENVDFNEEYQTMFICPDGRIKQCHEIDIPGYDEVKQYTVKYEPHWEKCCQWCKSVNDFMIFVKEE